ncbi:endonuclease/exonuclease/phosphatase family protein [Nocardioides massiliensis]|uniref:Endonuclease/exonuclease/phosphatase family metal-dependent hydrolase n=1 Tax=Nocardioides massiliensis TaxID=1325935 RepID=A0ABT9NKG4_9ACTN|nr:endonuclease/exonuclease/phosphatase family protein [Nocardioides massiliensis]MDP9820340.1 endonuclease/exonuclease/phosphatase family metal-dependent hydrolase [Nocardioides massiliensis]
MSEVLGWRVATANIASGRDRRTFRPALEHWLADAADLDVDLLALQEVDHLLERSGRVDQTAAIAEAVRGDGPAWDARFAPTVHGTPGRRTTMRPADGTTPHEPGYGIALLSRHPVEDWRELRMAPARLTVPVPDEQRVALAGVVRTPRGPATAVTTHLSFVPTRALAQLRGLVAWAEDLPRPLVLLGDLNLPAPVVNRVTGWQSAVRAATFPAPRPALQLDHVLLDADDTRPDGLSVRAGVAREVGRSDHRALRAELVIDGR